MQAQAQPPCSRGSHGLSMCQREALPELCMATKVWPCMQGMYERAHLSFTRWSRRCVGRSAARRRARSRFFLACAFLILRS